MRTAHGLGACLATTASTPCGPHLLEMAGDVEGAIAPYRTAVGRTTSLAENRYITTRAARIGAHRT